MGLLIKRILIVLVIAAAIFGVIYYFNIRVDYSQFIGTYTYSYDDTLHKTKYDGSIILNDNGECKLNLYTTINKKLNVNSYKLCHYEYEHDKDYNFDKITVYYDNYEIDYDSNNAMCIIEEKGLNCTFTNEDELGFTSDNQGGIWEKHTNVKATDLSTTTTVSSTTITSKK